MRRPLSVSTTSGETSTLSLHVGTSNMAPASTLTSPRLGKSQKTPSTSTAAASRMSLPRSSPCRAVFNPPRPTGATIRSTATGPASKGQVPVALGMAPGVLLATALPISVPCRSSVLPPAASQISRSEVRASRSSGSNTIWTKLSTAALALCLPMARSTLAPEIP